MSAFDAVLEEHGAAGLVTELRVAIEQKLRVRTVTLLSAMIRIDKLADHVAVHEARAAEVVISALTAFSNDAMIAQAALCALFRCWAGGIAPFDSEWVPTADILSAVLGAARDHASDLLVQQAALRLLKLHAVSGLQLVLAPSVVQVIAHATRTFPRDETIQSFAAEAICALNGIEVADWVEAHGQSKYEAFRLASLELAMKMKRPSSVRINGRDWQDTVLNLYPRLRSAE